jgi:phosphoenolpyruvate-protein phosphotransferase
MSENGKTLVLSGKTLAPGLGKGRTFVYRDVLTRFDEFYDIEDSQAFEEFRRFEEAIETVSDDLLALTSRVKQEIGSDLSGVFEAHLAMVQDASLIREVEREIEGDLVSAGTAVRTVFRRWERRFRAMEAEVARQKGDDLHDLARRILSSLAGVRAHALEELPHECVLVAARLLPSDTVFLARRNASAAILEFGGIGSHAALFARETGLPCVAGLPGLLEVVSPDVLCLVDADAAEVVIRPDRAQQNVFLKKSTQRKHASAEAMAYAHDSAITRSNKSISVFANVGNRTETAAAMENGAEGIGLYRIEQVYLGLREPPDTTALVDEMQRTLEPAQGLPVVVRLLDVGADKPLPFMEAKRESNPALGRRGIRFLERYPDLLQTQLDALLQIHGDYDLHILVPMVTLQRDIKWAREQLTDAASRVGTSHLPKLGAMIETPAAALAAADIAQYADFLSLGTNDLTQYTFAADRENAEVDTYFDDAHEVIFRLLKSVCDDTLHVPFSVCGELAGRVEYTSRLLACGITSLSVAPPLIPAVKEAIRRSG